MANQYTTRRYTKEDYTSWNDFVAKAKNATFLFHRDFMEYHSDRFEDYSLMVFDQSKRLVAILPANRVDNVVYSHQGLTYGGITVFPVLKFSKTLAVYQNILQFLERQKIKVCVIKMLPKIYSKMPTDELDYLLFLSDAVLIQSDLSITIDQSIVSEIQSNRMEGVKKGIKHNLKVREDGNLRAFWEQLLVPNLKERFQSIPTHTCEEIINLVAFFPKKIRHFNVYYKEKLVAGATLFVTETVAHAQYISANSDKQQLGSLDFLFHYLIKEVFATKEYFDLGTSSENSGKAVNKGLLYWKESFGGKGHIQNIYEVQTDKYKALDRVLL